MRPTVIELFAGVGGMSLGAARAKFDVRLAVELDPIASQSHAVNFPTSKHLRADVSKLQGEDLLKAAGLRPGQLSGLIGGPPCQGFSDIGKRAVSDPRNSLFADFFRLVAELRPKFFVAENVPGILAERNADIVKAALAKIPSNYVVLRPRELSADKVGAPTTRARVFFVGYDKNRMNSLSEEMLFDVDPAPSVNVGIALSGLPSIRKDWLSEEKSWRPVERLSRRNPFYSRVVDAVPEGVGSLEAIRRLRDDGLVSGCIATRHTDDVIERFSKVRPGATDKISRAVRLDRNGFCPTLRAGTGSERGSFQAVRPIHYQAPRVITPREAARLQGFPDWFQFHATKWHSFRQIGNSVSPLVSEFLLAKIEARLR